MYAWSLLLISLSIAVVTGSSNNSSLFISRDEANEAQVVTIEFNLGDRKLTPEQYRALRQAIIDALNKKRRGSTTTQTTMESTTTVTSQKQTTAIITTETTGVQTTTEVKTTTVQETTTSVPTATTAKHPDPNRKRKRNALWATTSSYQGNGFVSDDISFVNVTTELDNGIFRLSEILTKGDSKLSSDLLMDSIIDMDRTGELQKAIGSPITLVNVYYGFPKVPKPETKQSQRHRPGVSRLREILRIQP